MAQKQNPFIASSISPKLDSKRNMIRELSPYQAVADSTLDCPVGFRQSPRGGWIAYQVCTPDMPSATTATRNATIVRGLRKCS